ncbi:hypothetical protein ARMSODRAFT_451838 [Armillaria solidipes]|uniref:Uncharacterized protein n=1 Tax=Armillaria solidipes TaxID=1076256 RepID=A0A2H3B543_9AGAR|nr:hypothetical protein ARMSODRAFT_451838 [Armillaria solidipes]
MIASARFRRMICTMISHHPHQTYHLLMFLKSHGTFFYLLGISSLVVCLRVTMAGQGRALNGARRSQHKKSRCLAALLQATSARAFSNTRVGEEGNRLCDLPSFREYVC